MAERKCVFDPLVELMAHYAGKKIERNEVDRASMTVEERLKTRIIDGDQIGIDTDLQEAMENYEPLAIINTILLDGMKVVGELFGSGQMQLPFVLQSAETMKRAVAWLEPHMEKNDGSQKGTLILATVKGDVHDIGKNLVDIILTNNGYKVVNLGIKIPIDAMLEAVAEHNGDAIGMSGLLVKSTLVMKENLELMKGRGIDVPVILGGAALTRRYVEEDLRAIYGSNVAYATDAFDGLHYMEQLAAGNASWYDLRGTGDKEKPPSVPLPAGIDRGAVAIRVALEDELETLADLMGVMHEDLAAAPREELLVADLHESVIGGGRVRKEKEDVYELTNIVVLPEQWKGGVGVDLIRAMRRHARSANSDAKVFIVCDPDDTELIRVYRGLGFEQIDIESDERADIAATKINFCIATYGKAPALFIARSAEALGEAPEDSSIRTARHLKEEQGRDADFPVAIEGFESDSGVRLFRRTSDVERDIPAPKPPFWGSRVVENIRLEKVFEYINDVALIRGQWQVKKGSRSGEEYRRELDEVVYPKFEELKLRAKREGLLEPKVIYGYFPCRSDYNTLIVYRPKDLGADALTSEWGDIVLDEENLVEWQRFEFPRQSHGRHLCISDFYHSIESPEFDTLGVQIVTMGQRASEYAAELFARNDYADYLYFHGLSVECAEGLAEYWHRSMRIELGIAGDDAEDIRRLFAQGYRGSRYSFGYPACPNLEDQAQLFDMLQPSRIGIALSEEFMLEPEQSTSAIVVHHPEAKYFLVHGE